MAQTGSHHGSAKSWAAVLLMVTGVTVVGVAMLIPSWVVFWVGVALGAVGAVLGLFGGLLSDTPALPGEPGYQPRH